VSGGRKTDTRPTVAGRVMSILSSFSTEHPALGLAEISRSTGLPASTVFRLVRELCAWGAVERMADRRYRIGPRLAELAGLRGSPDRDLGSAVVPAAATTVLGENVR